MASDEGQGDDSGTSDEAEGNDPLVANRIDVRANERDCNDEVSEGEPVGAIREKRIVRICGVECFVDPINPGKKVHSLG